MRIKCVKFYAVFQLNDSNVQQKYNFQVLIQKKSPKYEISATGNAQNLSHRALAADTCSPALQLTHRNTPCTLTNQSCSCDFRPKHAHRHTYRTLAADIYFTDVQPKQAHTHRIRACYHKRLRSQPPGTRKNLLLQADSRYAGWKQQKVKSKDYVKPVQLSTLHIGKDIVTMIWA